MAGKIDCSSMSPHKLPVTKYGGQKWWWRFYAASVVLLAAWIFVLLFSSTSGVTVYSIFGLIWLSLLITLAGASNPAWRKVKLTDSALLIPKGFGTISIPISDIAGIGLLFCYWPFGTGWRKTPSWDLFVWRVDSSCEKDFAVSYFDRKQELPGLQLKPRRVDQDYVATRVRRADASRLAASRPGQVALDIYKRVLAAQGASGPLARQQLQKTASWSNQDRAPLTIAYWSPDGNIGASRWAQEREAPENPPIGWANT
jgi:hypothetical protein